MADLAALILDDPPELAVAGVSSGKSLNIDISTIQQHVNSRAATILRATSSTLGSLALKVVFAPDVREPHNLRREAKLLSELTHDNIIKLYNAYFIRNHHVLAVPFFPYTLRNLLDSPAFTPQSSDFSLVSHHLILQMCEAVAYVHSEQVAHRDISPGNWLVDQQCRVCLTDFGVAWSAETSGDEGSSNLQFELGTGPYRAPELLFGARDYDPFAVDLWALGCNIAEFFTVLESEVHDGDDTPDAAMPTWMKPKPVLKRRSLLNGGLSDFTLIGSMFKLLGTPTLETWPEAAQLPDFGKFSYKYFPPSDLRAVLVNAPADFGSLESVTFVQALLTYPRRQRLTAQAAADMLRAEQRQQDATELATALEMFIRT